MNIDRLVTMANEIASFFGSEATADLAVEGVVNHLTRFWEPRMKRQIATHFRQGGSGLTPVAAAAVAILAERY